MVFFTLLKSKSNICYSFLKTVAQEINLYSYAAYYHGGQQICILHYRCLSCYPHVIPSMLLKNTVIMITFQLWLSTCYHHRRHKVLQKTILFHIFQFQFIEFREEAPMINCKRKYAGRIFVSNKLNWDTPNRNSVETVNSSEKKLLFQAPFTQLTKKNDQQGETDFKITTNISVHM